VDRPYLITFLLLASTIAILETRRPMWLLPPLFLIWANCHGGFFLDGWWWRLTPPSALPGVAQEASSRRPPPVDRRRGFRPGFGRNPNGFRILQILLYYRSSYMTSRLLEWAPTRLWPPGEFTALLLGAAALLLRARRTVRPVDWLLFWRSPWPHYRRNAIPS